MNTATFRVADLAAREGGGGGAGGAAPRPAPARPDEFAARLSGPHGLELVVEMAHDLRSPLSSILFLADSMLDGHGGPVSDSQRRQLGIIYSAALGLCGAANDVIELARGGERLENDTPTPFSVTQLLESVRDIVRPIAEEKGLELRLVPPARDDRRGHAGALSRVLLNLTTNALKYTETGFVVIEARETGPSEIEFSVTDSGNGIDPRALAVLFQPFRKAAAREGDFFSCTGLGLAICRRLVAAMGAELQLETRVGWGTRFAFTVTLPHEERTAADDGVGREVLSGAEAA